MRFEDLKAGDVFYEKGYPAVERRVVEILKDGSQRLMITVHLGKNRKTSFYEVLKKRDVEFKFEIGLFYRADRR